jgi:hypothetical protein
MYTGQFVAVASPSAPGLKEGKSKIKRQKTKKQKSCELLAISNRLTTKSSQLRAKTKGAEDDTERVSA